MSGGSMLIPGLIPIIPAIIPKNSEPVNPVHNLQDRYTRDLSCQTVVAFIVTATCRSRVYSTRSSVPFWEKKKTRLMCIPTRSNSWQRRREIFSRKRDLKILINSRTRVSFRLNEFSRWIDGSDDGDDGKWESRWMRFIDFGIPDKLLLLSRR